MSSFTDPLEVQILDAKEGGRITAKLLTGFRYEVGDLGSGEVIDVPAGFITDFASVPRFAWDFEPPVGDAAKAAVVHDFLYDTGGLNGRYTRARCDAIFREALAVLGVGLVKRNILWAAVRIGGAGGFKTVASAVDPACPTAQNS